MFAFHLGALLPALAFNQVWNAPCQYEDPMAERAIAVFAARPDLARAAIEAGWGCGPYANFAPVDAAEAYARQGPHTARVFRRLLGQPKHPHRGLGLVGLAVARESAATPEILPFLDDPQLRGWALGRARDPEVALRLAELLPMGEGGRWGGGCGNAPIPEPAGWKAAEALAEMGAAAVPALTRALEAPEVTARERAAYALGLIGDRRAGKGLYRLATRDENDRVRVEATLALARVGDARGAEMLLQDLEKQPPDIEEALALTKFAHDPRVLRALRRWAGVNDEAAIAWGRMGRSDYRTQWESKLGQPMSANWARALGELRDPRSIGPLVAAVGEGDWDAQVALSKFGRLAVRPLRGLLRSPKRQVRASAITVLGWIGDPSVLPDLRRADEEVTADAEAAILHIAAAEIAKGRPGTLKVGAIPEG